MNKRSEVEKALEKPAEYGPDIDLSRYIIGEASIEEAGDIGSEISFATDKVGVDPGRVAYAQIDERALYTALAKMLSKYNVVVRPTRDAIRFTDLAKAIAWRLVDPASDKYTAAAYLYGGEVGYFVYVPPNVKVPVPIYTCLAIMTNKSAQFAHNIVVVDEGAEAHIVTGCTVPHGVADGLHVGISEYVVRRNARLTFTMIHAWTDGLHVRPRTSVLVEEGGQYVSYYVTYSPISSIQTHPWVRLGRSGRAYIASITASRGNGIYDIGSGVVLEEPGSSGEIVSRVVALDHSKVYARSAIEALESDTKGHIECLGLLLSDNATISSIPVISSKKKGALLSHEAAIGLIADREIEYLMSKGFTEEEAKSIIVKGFMSIEAPIPASIKREVDRIIDLTIKHAVG